VAAICEGAVCSGSDVGPPLGRLLGGSGQRREAVGCSDDQRFLEVVNSTERRHGRRDVRGTVLKLVNLGDLATLDSVHFAHRRVPLHLVAEALEHLVHRPRVAGTQHKLVVIGSGLAVADEEDHTGSMVVRVGGIMEHRLEPAVNLGLPLAVPLHGRRWEVPFRLGDQPPLVLDDTVADRGGCVRNTFELLRAGNNVVAAVNKLVKIPNSLPVLFLVQSPQRTATRKKSGCSLEQKLNVSHAPVDNKRFGRAEEVTVGEDRDFGRPLSIIFD